MYLHGLMMVPKNGVCVKISGWIEPKVNPLFLVTFSVDINIRLNSVRLPCPVSQEFEVKFVSYVICVRIHLKKKNVNKYHV